ncbi:hypothetical protein PPN31114_04063 [Pandoraea pneumonica]|jgi:ribosomal protein L16 Arg81 hydroxylase|uniref:JmjC domain-containing protein n=1 Tax=Pandoraea pneumonica TaxID=2508299 RepID=A0A5E4XT39_9BURK|nr:cupin domain-containing protein [Pandoraea pneumonica]VVE39238.1 hypothetical protein PPN31114_04063 [Pandoraea pneumonica]
MKIKFSISKDDFYSNYFEKIPLHLSRIVPSDVYSWSDLSETIYGVNLTGDFDIKMHMNGVLGVYQYTEKYQDIYDVKVRISTSRVESLLKDGATLLINRMDLKDATIASICHEVSDYLNVKTVANAYAAFGGKGTFGRHWDTHDVIAVQMIGRKAWKVFPPTLPYPLDHQKSKYRKDECPEEPSIELVLEQGDALYIPRGWWHEATPIDAQETFHIAVGLHTAKVTDYVAWIANQILPAMELARRSFYPFSEDSRGMIDIAERICQELKRKENQELFLCEMSSLNNEYKKIEFDRVIDRK